jgi:hypothetical protein
LLINRNIQAQPQLVRTDDALQEFPPFDGSLITKNPPPFTPVPSPSNKLFFRRLAALRRKRLPGFTVIEWSVRGRLWNAARGHYRNHSREDRHSGRDQWIETRREDRNQSERAQQWNENTGDRDHKLFQNLTLILSAAPLPDQHQSNTSRDKSKTDWPEDWTTSREAKQQQPCADADLPCQQQTPQTWFGTENSPEYSSDEREKS